MARGDWYFSVSPLGGVGKLHFLKVLQAAPEGSSPRALLGSLVVEGDHGFLSTKEYPVPQHSHKARYITKFMAEKMGMSQSDIFQSVDLHHTSQTLKIEKTTGGSLGASFPGVPFSAGIELDYKELIEASIDLGVGAKKMYIPRDLLRQAYEEMAKASSTVDADVFDDDRMVVDQILLVRNMTLTLKSKREFSADFEARAKSVNDLSVGVKYKRVSERSYAVEIACPDDYLFALGAVQGDKFI